MTNPFIFSSIVTDEHFCKRDELIALKTHMINSTNVVLFSKRRYGKSSLIKEIFKNEIDKKEYLLVYFDIFNISTANDFAYMFYKAVAKSLRTDLQSTLKTLKNIFSKATFSASVSQNGEIEFKPTLAEQNFEETIEDIFTNLDAYLKRHKLKAIIAIDEFQQIAYIKEHNMEAILRKYIQNMNNVSFVYSGSKRHMLTQMFSDNKKPFYNQALPMELKAISKDNFFNFVSQKFEKSNKKIDKKAFELLYSKVNAESWLIQNICYHLWQKYDYISCENVETTIDEITAMSDAIFRTLYDNFSNTQKSALKILIQNNGVNLLSKETLSKNNISKSSLVSALKVLYEKEIIDKNGDIYYINDKLYELWLVRVFR